MNPIDNAIFKNDFETAQQLFEQNVPWDLKPFMASQAYGHLLDNKQFGFLKLFIDKEYISLDIFEYDHFEGTIFKQLIGMHFDDDLSSFLDEILPEVENIDDELGGVNWLGLAIKNKSSISFIEKLIENGCDINYKNSNEQSLLFMSQDLEMCNFLLNSGIDVNAKSNGGTTVLQNAVSNRNIEFVTALLDFGADPNATDSKGETAYHNVLFNAISPELYTLLSQYDPPRFDALNSKGESLFFQFVNESSDLSWESQIQLFQLMLNDGADMFQLHKDDYGEEKNPAEILIEKSFEIFQKILEQESFNPNQQDNKGNTWLHLIASENLNFDQQKAKVFYQKIKALLKLGADPNLRNDQDKTPKDLASDDNLKAKGLALLLKH